MTSGIDFQTDIPDTTTTFANAFKVGRDLAGQRIQDNAMTAYGQNPAGTIDPRLAAVNPTLFGQVMDRRQAAGDRQSSVDQATAQAGGDYAGAMTAAASRGATKDVSELSAQQKAAAADFADQVGGVVHGIAARTQDPAERIALVQHFVASDPRIAAVMQHAGLDPMHLTPDQVSDQALGAIFEGMQGLKASLAADKPEVVGKDSSLLFKPGSLGASGGGEPDATSATPAATSPTPEAAGGVPGMVTAAAQKYGVDPNLALAIAHAESNFDPDAKSPKGALGVMQLMPATAQGLGVDPTDPAANIDGGVRYIAQLAKQFGNDPKLIAAAYNAGPGAVVGHGGVPPYPETQAYVSKVTGSPPGSYDVASLGATPPPPSAPSSKKLPGGFTLVTPGGPAEATAHGHISTPAELKAAGLAPNTQAWTNAKGEVGDLPKGLADQSSSPAGLGDPTKTGAEYLATIPAADRSLVQAYVDGRQPIPTGAALRNPMIARLLQEASQYDPSFDATKYGERSKLYNDVTSGDGSKQILQLNKVAGHLAQLSGTIDPMHNGSFTPLNVIGNVYSKTVGEPAVTNFEQARDVVVEEVGKLFKGGAADVSGTKRAIETLKDSNSPAQLHGAIATLAELVNEQMRDQKLRYDRGMGSKASNFETVSPQARDTLAKLANLTAAKLAAAGSAPARAAPTRAAPTAAHRMSDADLKASLGL